MAGRRRPRAGPALSPRVGRGGQPTRSPRPWLPFGRSILAGGRRRRLHRPEQPPIRSGRDWTGARLVPVARSPATRKTLERAVWAARPAGHPDRFTFPCPTGPVPSRDTRARHGPLGRPPQASSPQAVVAKGTGARRAPDWQWAKFPSWISLRRSGRSAAAPDLSCSHGFRPDDDADQLDDHAAGASADAGFEPWTVAARNTRQGRRGIHSPIHSGLPSAAYRDSGSRLFGEASLDSSCRFRRHASSGGCGIVSQGVV